MDLNGSVLPWPGAIRAYANPGLSTCLEERRLCSDRSPVPISALEIEAVRLAEWAFARGRTLVVCPADPLAPLSGLIAAAVHIADMAAYYRESGRALGSSKHVAVVTSDYRARGFYRGLGIRHPRSNSVAPLLDTVPAATLGRDSVVRVLGANPANGWSTVFASSIAALSAVPNLDLVIVDLPCPDVERVFDLRVPAVLVAGDPSDPLLARADTLTLVFGWDHTDLERIAGDDGLPARLARRAHGRCEVIAVPAHRVCENAALFWQDIGPLTRAARRSAVAGQLAREAFTLFHDLSGLALPTAAYEGLTVPVKVRLDAIAAATRLTRGEVRDLYLPMAEAELRDLAAALGAEPPKRDALVLALQQALDDHDDVMLVARTAELARLHRADLASRGRLGAVRVTSLGALAEEAPADVAVLTGMAPTWARWVYRCGVATSVRVLAYTPDGPLESVARGYDEVERISKVVGLQVEREAWLGRACAKDAVWSALSGDARLVDDDGRSTFVPRNAVRVPVTTVAPPDVPPGLWDGDRWFADLEPAGFEDSTASDRGATTRSGASVVTATRITFDDGRWTLVEAAGTVTRLRPGSGTPDGAHPVSSVRDGDRLLFFDGDSRKGLLAKVIEVAVEVPGLAVAAAWVAHWRRVLAAAYASFGTYSALAEALWAEGCTVQDQTIRLWVIGVTIGPDDDEDVRRVGIVMDDAVLRDRYDEVCRGIRSLRGAHVRLGLRLSELAMRVGSSAEAGLLESDEVVDERSGLTVADFRESVDILTVAVVEPAGEVPYVLIGSVNAPEREDDDE